jgi:hypothetical protein
MRRLARCFARLYPRRWRARYGREFDALLEDVNLTWRDVFGVALSALGEKYMSDPEVVPRIVNLASRDIPHGYELETAVEYPRGDGSTMLVRAFCREVDLGDSYVTLNHNTRGSEPAQTILVFGRKGKVDGDFRTDETEMLVLRPDGSVHRTEQTVKTWLKYDGLRDRLRDRYRTGMQAGQTPDQIRQQIEEEGTLQSWS